MIINNYIKEFILRGLLFMGLGPIIMGIIYFIIDINNPSFNLTGSEILISTLSISMLTFVHAGSSMFHQVEHWSPMKSAFIQLLCIYIIYITTYLVNSWIPFKWEVILIVSISIILGYIIIFIIVSLIVNKTTKKLNNKL
jgi:hypothetical protein